MRKLLFRGQTRRKGDYTLNGEPLPSIWIYGGLLQERTYSVIVENLNQKPSVHPETICQYTGYDDQDNKKIFEHDVIEVYNDDEYKGYGEVTFYGGCWYVEGHLNDSLDEIINIYDYQVKVIGNTFDKEFD